MSVDPILVHYQLASLYINSIIYSKNLTKKKKPMIFMDSCLLLLVLSVFILYAFRVESSNLSEEEDLELERQLKLLNKPAIRTIKTDYGDVYDCVDFYKQPAFDHPLLKNFTFEKSTLLQIQKRGIASLKMTRGIGLQGGGCPLGSIPIKRITKEDLIREKRVSKLIESLVGDEPNRPRRRPEQPPDIYKKHAIARTRAGPNRYQGIACLMSIHNPQCVENQYSAARMKMSNGPDSIEVGWRVDPTFSASDSLTRFYIRTDVGQTHCYNLRCPGFIATSTQTPIDVVAEQISKFGGPIYSIHFIINWNAKLGLVLQAGPTEEQIGFWPTNIFSVPGGLGEMASSLDWGGEVFSPKGSPSPPMGGSNFPVNDTDYCSFMAQMRERDASGTERFPSDLEPFSDREPYEILIKGDQSYPVDYLILYGGPGGSTD